MGRPTGRPAGRPKKQPTFEPPGFKQAVRARFIEYARRHGSAALHLLATDVWRGEMTLDAWAKSFNVAGTWVEAWAALTRRDSSKAQIGVDTAKLKQARAQVQQSQASLKQLEEQLGYTTIIAPMDGVILSRDVEIGDAVSSILVLGSTATLVMTEGDTTEVYVQGKVDEADIAHVYMGQPARIKVESFRDRLFYGKVTKIAPMGVEKDNVTTFEVRVSI